MSSPLRMFSRQDCRLLAEHSWLAGAEVHGQLDSTNRRALECCRQRAPHLVVAERQAAGRGRGGNRWWSEPGGLMFSLTLDAPQYGLPLSRLPLLSLVAGWSVRQTLLPLLPDADVRLKWPNDVFVDGRKICGILLESSDAARGHVVVGIGLNVCNDLGAAPEDVRRRATTLAERMADCPRLIEVLDPLLEQLRRSLDLLAEDELRMHETWSEACLLQGRTVKVQLSRELVEGRCEGIDENGALLLRTAVERRKIVAGVVVEVDGRSVAAP